MHEINFIELKQEKNNLPESPTTIIRTLSNDAISVKLNMNRLLVILNQEIE